jgi:hypothetical protein
LNAFKKTRERKSSEKWKKKKRRRKQRMIEKGECNAKQGMGLLGYIKKDLKFGRKSSHSLIHLGEARASTSVLSLRLSV